MSSILVIGGTRFLGKHIVDAALANGHRVTVFHRGKTSVSTGLPVEEILGDREHDLARLAGRRWDAVIDTCGFVPRVVRLSAEALKDAVDRYFFISTLSVYADITPHEDESAPLATIDDPTNEDVPQFYGALKVLCEQAVDAVMPGRGVHVRAGLIVGPHDYVNRFPYWVRRLAEGGEVLAPGDDDSPVQIIDARDIADWIMHNLHSDAVGAYNLTGHEQPLRIEDVLQTVHRVVGGDARFTWVSDEFLLAQNMQPMDSLVFWLPADADGFAMRKVERAVAAGLRFRPLEVTARDTWDWLQANPTALTGADVRGGISREEEARLLAAWHAQA
jgi:2'-hydroxyisoflavone reductase